jgi:hypothetical protein
MKKDIEDHIARELKTQLPLPFNQKPEPAVSTTTVFTKPFVSPSLPGDVKRG